MPMNNRLLSANNFLRGLIAVLAFFPGVAVYRELVEVPPDFLGAVKIISFSVSIMVLVCIPLLSDKINSVPMRKFAVYALIAVLLGGASLIGYRSFAKEYVGTWQTETGSEKQFIIPIFPSENVQAAVDREESPTRQKGYERALEGGDGATFKVRLESDNWDSFLLMVILLVLSQVLLVAPLVAAAWRATSPRDGVAVQPAAPAPARARRRSIDDK